MILQELDRKYKINEMLILSDHAMKEKSTFLAYFLRGRGAIFLNSVIVKEIFYVNIGQNNKSYISK